MSFYALAAFSKPVGSKFHPPEGASEISLEDPAFFLENQPDMMSVLEKYNYVVAVQCSGS